MKVNIDKLAEIIWEYHLLHHDLKKSDCILVLCSNDIRVAEHAANLFLDDWAPLLIFSGGVGELTQGMYGCSEAEYFASISVKKGVPMSKILIESRSTNTGENIKFTKELLRTNEIDVNDFIIVQKPFMERRSYATFKNHLPQKNLILSSPNISFSDYPNQQLPKESIINVMVGDLQRLKEYPKKGFQIPQDIPKNVWDAYLELISSGYDKHLIT